MDVDAVQPTRYSPFIHFFDTSTTSFPWSSPRPEQIRLRRALMDDTLIFDILLTSGGVGDPYVLYPPESPEGLQRLLDKIESSNYDALKKDCLVYFLLKWHQDGRERHFMDQRCIPPQFVALADAYWHLDTGVNLPRAVALLSDPRLNRDYSSKIIRTISLSPDSAPLIRRYIQTAKPLLVEPPDIDTYALALADFSILEAWQFSRTFNEADPTRERLLKKILEWCVSPQPRPLAIKQLLHLPFSPFEEKILVSFASPAASAVSSSSTSTPFPSLTILQTLMTTRLLLSGRYIDAIKLDSEFYNTTPQKFVSSSEVSERRKMVKDIYNALGSVEKSLADLDLVVDKSKPEAKAKATIGPTVPVDTPPPRRPVAHTPVRPLPASSAQDLSQSWEEVHVPETLVSKSTPLREVRMPGAQVPGTVPRFPAFVGFGASSSTSNTSPAPLLPTNGFAGSPVPKATPRKSLPLAQSILGSTKPRSSFGALGNGTPGQRMSFGTPMNASAFGASLNNSVTASPLSGMKIPNPSFAASRIGHGGLGQSMLGQSPKPDSQPFISASQQSNAFYQPTKKTNGVKRSFEDDFPVVAPRDENMEKADETNDEEVVGGEVAKPASQHALGDEMDEDEKELEDEKDDGFQFSVFSGKNHPVTSANGAISSAPPPKKKKRGSGTETTSKRTSRKRGVPPGSFGDQEQEDDEGDSREVEEPEEVEQPTSGRTRRSARTSTQKGISAISSASAVSASSKPPAKRARKTKDVEASSSAAKKPLSRSIPGGLMDEDEYGDDDASVNGSAAPSIVDEDDEVPPLPTKSRRTTRAQATGTSSKAATKGRTSTSAESMAEELGTRRTRRSTRLGASASTEEVEQPITKGRKSTKAPAKKSSRR